MSLEDINIKTGNNKAKILARSLDEATGKLLDNNKIIVKKEKNKSIAKLKRMLTEI